MSTTTTTTTTTTSSPLPRSSSSTPFSWLRGFIFTASILVTGFHTTVFILVPAAWFFLIIDRSVNRHIYHSVVGTIVGKWLYVPTAALELFGMSVHVHSSTPLPDPNESILLISNHPTTADWVYLWSLLVRHGNLSYLKIVLKDVIRRAPIAGWALIWSVFLFVRRNWEADQKHITNFLQTFAHHKMQRVQLLIFPEGTDRNPEGIAKSQAYATQHGLSQYQHVLHPRTTGFIHCMDVMTHQPCHLHSVWDVTIAHQRDTPPKFPSLMAGIFPHRVDFLVTRFPIKELPQEKEKLTIWCQERWKLKEQILNEFYANGDRFPTCVSSSPTTSSSAIASLAFWFLTFWSFSFLSIFLCYTYPMSYGLVGLIITFILIVLSLMSPPHTIDHFLVRPSHSGVQAQQKKQK